MCVAVLALPHLIPQLQVRLLAESLSSAASCSSRSGISGLATSTHGGIERQSSEYARNHFAVVSATTSNCNAAVG